MRLVLLREGDVLKPESGKLPRRFPKRVVAEFSPMATKLPVMELWAPAFPAGSEQEMREFIREQTSNAAKQED
jgi:hypothetical protein